MKNSVTWFLLTALPVLGAVMVGCGAGSAVLAASISPVPAPDQTTNPAPVGGPTAGTSSCLLLTYTSLNGSPTPTYVPSVLDTVSILPGDARLHRPVGQRPLRQGERVVRPSEERRRPHPALRGVARRPPAGRGDRGVGVPERAVDTLCTGIDLLHRVAFSFSTSL